MSADPSNLLDTAQAIVAEQLMRLRTLCEAAQQRSGQLAVEVRQAERAYDEAVLQYRFAVEHGLPSAAALGEREQQLRVELERLTQAHRATQRSLRQLDQLVRQIDMSSATLKGSGEGERADPWAQALRSQIIKGREEERVRLAREVHDGPAQVLANALMGLERTCTLLQDQRLDDVGVMLDRMRDTTREGLAEVRRFIADLRPGRLEEHGLVAAIQEYVRRYREAYGAKVLVEADPVARLPAETAIVLYRIVQEALQNVHKHARGASIHVVLVVRQGQLFLTVRDDGPGFDPREVARRAGRESWGLTSMRERAELIGARLTVTTRPGHGTEVAVVLPL